MGKNGCSSRSGSKIIICLPSRTWSVEPSSILAAQYQSWWESRLEPADGGRLTAAKPRLCLRVSSEWAPEHRWSRYLPPPCAAAMKLLKPLKINSMSKRLACGEWGWGGAFQTRTTCLWATLLTFSLTCTHLFCSLLAPFFFFFWHSLFWIELTVPD